MGAFGGERTSSDRAISRDQSAKPKSVPSSAHDETLHRMRFRMPEPQLIGGLRDQRVHGRLRLHVATSTQPSENAGKFIGIEPNAVIAANINNDAAGMSIVDAVRQLSTDNARAIEGSVRRRFAFTRTRRQAELGCFLLRRVRNRPRRHRLLLCPLDEFSKRFVANPQARTASAFENRHLLFAQPPAGQNVAVLA